MPDESTELTFTSKYDLDHSEAYFKKHQQGFWRNLSNARELKMAGRSLAAAGRPDSILDLPCGAGRFWQLLSDFGASKLIAADASPAMLEVASSSQPPELSRQFDLLQTSAFDINLPDASVDNIFCMRLIHHVGDPQDRLKLLKEFFRVTRETVCISLWVDGNYQSWRRSRLEARRAKKSYQNRFVIPASVIEQEFHDAGFNIKAQYDMLPYISMWRTYVLGK